MSGNEVSELLGSSAANVSRRLHEGLDRLRRLLAERTVDVGLRGTGTVFGPQRTEN